MTNREYNILNAAIGLFSRYGVKRTSMADLANEAEVSRQTLYNAYKNKDAVLQALIRYYTDMTIKEIEIGLEGITELGKQLDIVFEKISIAGFDRIQATPNAQDIIDGFNAAGQKELENSAAKFRNIIETLLLPYEESLKRAKLSASEVADMTQRFAKSATSNARDRDSLIGQIRTLKRLCLAATSVGTD